MNKGLLLKHPFMFSNSNYRRGGRSLIAPTSVYAVGLIRKTQTKTVVGAISDRPPLRQLFKKTIKDCIQVVQSLIFAKFPDNLSFP